MATMMRICAFQSAVKSSIVVTDFEVESHILPLDELFFFLGVDIQVGVSLLQPGMVQSLHCGQALIGING